MMHRATKPVLSAALLLLAACGRPAPLAVPAPALPKAGATRIVLPAVGATMRDLRASIGAPTSATRVGDTKVWVYVRTAAVGSADTSRIGVVKVRDGRVVQAWSFAGFHPGPHLWTPPAAAR